jgi:hypothetical protein
MAIIRCPSTSASSAPAPRCSPTQPSGASTTHSSHHLRFPTDQTAPSRRSFPGDLLPSLCPKASFLPRRRPLFATPSSPCRRDTDNGRAVVGQSARRRSFRFPVFARGLPTQLVWAWPIEARCEQCNFLFSQSLIKSIQKFVGNSIESRIWSNQLFYLNSNIAYGIKI